MKKYLIISCITFLGLCTFLLGTNEIQANEKNLVILKGEINPPQVKSVENDIALLENYTTLTQALVYNRESSRFSSNGDIEKFIEGNENGILWAEISAILPSLDSFHYRTREKIYTSIGMLMRSKNIAVAQEVQAFVFNKVQSENTLSSWNDVYHIIKLMVALRELNSDRSINLLISLADSAVWDANISIIDPDCHISDTWGNEKYLDNEKLNNMRMAACQKLAKVAFYQLLIADHPIAESWRSEISQIIQTDESAMEAQFVREWKIFQLRKLYPGRFGYRS